VRFGWDPRIIYISDAVQLFDRFGAEIWEMATADADELDSRNVCEFIAGFSRADMLDDFDWFKNLMVWYACEKVARDIAGDR
jgi:hypothetical protein